MRTKTLADVYKERTAIIEFTKNLEMNVKNSMYNDEKDISLLFKNLNYSYEGELVKKPNETKEDYRKRVTSRDLRTAERNYKVAFGNALMEARNDFMYHMVALKTYGVLLDHYNTLKNESNELNPIVKEEETNVKLFKALMVKNGITTYELNGVEDHMNEDKMESLVRKACMKSFKDNVIEAEIVHQVYTSSRSVNLITSTAEKCLSMENIRSFNAIYEKSSSNAFYATLKNSGYNFFRGIRAPEVEIEDKGFTCPKGYMMDSHGVLVEKDVKGFFPTIAHLFHKLMNKSTVDAYNRELAHAKADCNIGDAGTVLRAYEEAYSRTKYEDGELVEMTNEERDVEFDAILNSPASEDPNLEWNKIDGLDDALALD